MAEKLNAIAVTLLTGPLQRVRRFSAYKYIIWEKC